MAPEEILKRNEKLKYVLEKNIFGLAKVYFLAQSVGVDTDCSFLEPAKPLKPVKVKKIGEVGMIIHPRGYSGLKFANFTKSEMLKRIPADKLAQADAYSAKITDIVHNGWVERVNGNLAGASLEDAQEYFATISLYKTVSGRREKPQEPFPEFAK